MRIFISGLTGKRLLVSVFLLFLAGMAFGGPLKIDPPIFSGPDDIVRILDEKADIAFGGLKEDLKELDDMLDIVSKNFSNFTTGFANASVFSSDGASQRGYEGYKAFSFTFGFMGAAQLPDFKVISKISDAIQSDDGNIGPDLLEEISDIPFGFDIQAINAQFGINTSFLLKGLYLGFKFSKFDTDWMNGIPISGFSFKTLSIGGNISYQLISQKRLLAGLLVWRGLNLGTGLIWQNTSLVISPDIPMGETITIPIEPYANIDIPVKGEIDLRFETSNYIVPIEAMTSIRLLGFFNVALGAGVDLAFGSSKIGVSGSLNVDVDNVNNQLQFLNVTMVTAPNLEMDLRGKSNPRFINLKLMGAVGFNFGPIIIDIPLTYYFTSNGYSVGVTFGLTI